MEIRLLLIDATGHERPVAVGIPKAGCSVRELTHALALHVHDQAATGLFSKRQDRLLPPGIEVRSAGILEGDQVVLMREGNLDRTSSRGTSGEGLGDLAELEVVGGPRQGQRFTISKGVSLVGREGGSDVQLDDPAVSRTHLRVVVDGKGIEVDDAGSRNGSFIGGVPITGPRRLRPDDIVEIGGSLLRFRTLNDLQLSSMQTGDIQDAPLGRLPFNRPPRLRSAASGDKWVVPTPPDEPRRSRFPLGAMVVPLLMGVGLYLATKQPTMLLFTALTPAMAIWTFIEDRKTGRSGFKQGLGKFEQALETMIPQIAAAMHQEGTQRREESPSAADLLRRAELRASELWERRPHDNDFLRLRVGWADLPTRSTIEFPDSGKASLIEDARARISSMLTIPSVPLEVSLEDLGIVGLTGPRPDVDSLGRWFVAQIAGLHSPNEVKIWSCFSRDTIQDWEWLSWLPHTQTSLSGGHAISFGPDETKAHLDSLRKTVLQRKEAFDAFSNGEEARSLPRIVLLFDERLAPDRSLLKEILDFGPAHGVFTVWLGSRRESLPGQCLGILDLDGAPAAVAVTDAKNGTVRRAAGVEGLDIDLAAELSRKLAPLIDVGHSEAESVLPTSLTLLDVLGADKLSTEAIKHKWATPSGLAGVIGATRTGLLALDLREHGPHALLGGTTGAGKSELLRTLVASLALENSPKRLNFILIDYKGGSAFKDCVNLPHTVGFVTDLDGHLARRALVSLNAELKRRERQLRDASCSDLVEMEARFPNEAPPSILIVIDEFAALAKELPEFVEGVVGISQTGRSLGIHLLLATQRPAGVITDQIRANTNIRIALRMNDDSDSRDVVGVDDAARIPKVLPGRGYVRTGHGELSAIQTAYVGGHTPIDVTEEIYVRDLSLTAPGVKAAGSARREGDLASDLERIVETVVETWRPRSLDSPPKPWMPPLGSVIALDEAASLPSVGGDAAFSVLVGVGDDPQRQAQFRYQLPLAKGSVAIFGAGGSGKSTLLRTLAVSMSLALTPDQVNIYVMDFATRALESLEALPHVGSVLNAGDQERVLRLLSMLEKEVDQRKLRFAQLGSSSYEEYLKVANDPVPRVVVLLDGYSGFASALEKIEFGKWVDFIPRLIADGRSLGIYFVITAERRGAISGALSGVISTRVVLRMADPDDYSALGLRFTDVKDLEFPPGRGIVDGTLEAQFASIGDPPGGDEDAHRIYEVGRELAAKSSAKARPVRALSTHVLASDLTNPSGPLKVAIGLRDEDLTEAFISLNEDSFLICGPYKSGRTTALGRIARGSIEASDSNAYLLSPRASALSTVLPWIRVAESPTECEQLSHELTTTIESAASQTTPVLVFVDDAEELFDFGGSYEMENLVRAARKGLCRFVVAAEIQSARRALSGWFAEIRKEKSGLLLAPDLDIDGDLFAIRLPRWPRHFPPGRGYLISRGQSELVQVAVDHDAGPPPSRRS